MRVSADPWALEGPFGLVKRPQTMKFLKIIIMEILVRHLALSPMDFPDDPAAIHGSRLIISCARQDAGPNELTNPEIFKKNHHKITPSFGLILPAIFPDTDISSCACIVLLSEASSSSHVILQHCASAQPLGSEGSPEPRQTSPNYKICNISHHARDLVPAQSFSYGFS